MKMKFGFMKSHPSSTVLDRMYEEAFTWSKDALHQLQKPFGTLDSVNLKDLNRLNKPERVCSSFTFCWPFVG